MVLQRETLLAFQTLIRPVTRMKQHMGIQTMFMGETLPAVRAHVWPDPRVRACVRGQMVLQKKRLPALITKVRSRLLPQTLLNPPVFLLDFRLASELHRVQGRENLLSVALLDRHELLFRDVVEEKHGLSQELAFGAVGYEIRCGVSLDGIFWYVGLDCRPVCECGEIGGRTHLKCG